MTTSQALWAHQTRALEMAGAAFAKGARSVCVVAPTGSGKTVLGREFISRHLIKKPAGKALFLAHREELVSQAYDTLTAGGLWCGVIQANPTREYNPYRPVQVASIQTLLARDQRPDATLLVIDEFHHFSENKFAELASHYRQRKIPLIGLTATPIRADGRGFEGLMDALVVPTSMKDLIQQGFLVPYELVAPPSTLKNDQIAQKPVDAYREHALGRKAIVFAGNVKAATEFACQFRDAGISCEVVWGDMDVSKRRQVLDAYKAGEIRVLSSVAVLTEGFDDRPTSCVILARSVGSLGLYLQMTGRALRCAEGKRDAIIIDLHGSCRIHDEPAADREWTLEGDGVVKKNLEQPKERFCLVCKVLLEPDAAGVCDLCGIARPEAMPPDVVGVKLVKYAAKLREPPEVRRAYFEKLKAVARANGWNRFQPHAKYRAIYQEAPPREWW